LNKISFAALSAALSPQFTKTSISGEMMRTKTAWIAVLALALIVAGFQTGSTAGTLTITADERRIFDLVNRERSRARLSSLQWNEQLAYLARGYSRKMAREGFFDHIDTDGNSVVQRAGHARISGWTKIGENLFLCEPIDRFSEFAVRGWMKSASHRRNILDPDWGSTGIGVAFARNGDIYVTQVFAAD
jgi:uncharacterized protein YkwD